MLSSPPPPVITTSPAAAGTAQLTLVPLADAQPSPAKIPLLSDTVQPPPPKATWMSLGLASPCTIRLDPSRPWLRIAKVSLDGGVGSVPHECSVVKPSQLSLPAPPNASSGPPSPSRLSSPTPPSRRLTSLSPTIVSPCGEPTTSSKPCRLSCPSPFDLPVSRSTVTLPRVALA